MTVGSFSQKAAGNRAYSGVSQILVTKETSITRHLLPGRSDWELLLLVVETMLIGPEYEQMANGCGATSFPRQGRKRREAMGTRLAVGNLGVLARLAPRFSTVILIKIVLKGGFRNTLFVYKESKTEK